VLLVAAVGSIAYQLMPAGAPQRRAKPAAGQAEETTGMTEPEKLKTVEVNIDELLANIQQVNFNYQRERIDRNPMEPLITRLGGEEEEAQQQGPAGPWRVLRKNVTGIIWDEYSPVAVVDNEVVGVGHTYPDGVEVYAIEPERVIFKVGDSLLPVKMKEL